MYYKLTACLIDLRSWKHAALINSKVWVTQSTSGLVLVLEYSGITR